MKLDPDAIIILLADQPFVASKIINAFFDHYQKERSLFFIAAGEGESPMPPVLFSAACFPSCFNCGKLARHGKIIDFQNPMLFYDVDTLDDYSLLCRLSKDIRMRGRGEE
ncbi:NTP transferase domain-containing protein [Peribacillus glennii]|uniref:NTP transferase domain-containing protein n=1 Tax=Peribacillus glennii TaxID=2303991 RepID=UPI0022778FFE|nr:NTP transferase domain-containing protein [Peribacillus glennii]